MLIRFDQPDQNRSIGDQITVGSNTETPLITAIDTATGKLMVMNSFYYIGHFSKFIRPGARRVLSSPTTDTLLTTAWRNPDGRLAIVVLNTTDTAQPFTIDIAQRGSAATVSPAHSILTLVQ